MVAGAHLRCYRTPLFTLYSLLSLRERPVLVTSTIVIGSAFEQNAKFSHHTLAHYADISNGLCGTTNVLEYGCPVPKLGRHSLLDLGRQPSSLNVRMRSPLSLAYFH